MEEISSKAFSQCLPLLSRTAELVFEVSEVWKSLADNSMPGEQVGNINEAFNVYIPKGKGIIMINCCCSNTNIKKTQNYTASEQLLSPVQITT